VTGLKVDAGHRPRDQPRESEAPMSSTRFNPQEALVCSMVLMAASDRTMTDAELAMMSRLVQALPVFSDFHPNGISSVTEACLTLLDKADGLDRACTLIREALPSRLRETAYVLACEVAAADGDLTQEELQFLQDFRIAMDIDRLIAGAIERATRARYQVI
jgi:tellurite resistance protein